MEPADHHCAAHRRGNQGRHARQSGHWDPDGGGKLHPGRAACLLPIRKRADRDRRSTPGRHGASHAHGRRRPTRHRAARRLHVRQRDVVRSHSRWTSRSDRARSGLQVDQTWISGQLDDSRTRWCPAWAAPWISSPAPSVSLLRCSTARKGAAKIVKKCTLPITADASGGSRRDRTGGDRSFGDGRATLLETGPGVSVADVLAATEAELVIPDHVPEMPH